MNKIIILGNPLANSYGIARSLVKAGYKVILIQEPTNFNGMKYSRYIEKVYTLDKLEDAITVLLDVYGNEKEKPILLCGSDPSICLLDSNYNLLCDKFIFFNAGEEGRITYLMDKEKTFPIAEKYGFTKIKSWRIAFGDKLPEDISYPCLIKGNNSTKSTKLDMYICQCEDELKGVIRPGVDYLVQEYIIKDYELNIVGFAYNQGKNVFIPGVVRKIRDEIHRQSVFIRLDDIKDYPKLHECNLKGFISELRYEGIFSIETIYSKGKFYFLEVNMRNDGCGWLYTAGNINYPALWVKYGQGILDGLTLNSLHIKAPLYLMAEDDIYNLIEGKVSLKQWIKDVARTRATFSAHLKDPFFFFYGLMIHVRQAFKLVCRKIFKLNWN